MPRHFFITGLPRCRSAWFANFLTYDDSFCWHDGFHGLDKVEDFRTRMDAQWHVIGNSDPANIFFWEQLQEWYPDAKWIVIKRDFEQTFKSCQRAFELFDRKILWAMADKLQDLIRALNPPVYDFDSIRATTAKLIATQCGVKVGSPERVSMLSHMNVQVESKYLKSEIERFMHEPPTWARETAGRI